MKRLSVMSYEKIHVATLAALGMMPEEFTLQQLIQDTNILLEPEGLTTTDAATVRRVKEQVTAGTLVAINPAKKGRGKGNGKGRVGMKYKVIRDIIRIGAVFTAPKAVKKRKQHKDLPEIEGLTPQDVSKFMLNYMTKTLGIMNTINDLDTVRKDAASVHELQAKNQELVMRHNENRIKMDKLKREKEKWANLSIRHEQLSKHYDQLVNKLAKVKKDLNEV